MLAIAESDLRYQNEPFARPFGFKGASFDKKCNALVRLTSPAGTYALGIGGLAPLWADASVFIAHGEDASNQLMLDTLGFALRHVTGRSFADPPALLADVLPAAHDFAASATNNPALSHTFTLNALVALDNAAWVLHAREQSIATFDQLIPAVAKSALSAQHHAVAAVPLVGYAMPDEKIQAMLAAGVSVIKIKLGQAGDEQTMLEKDLARLAAIHDLANAHDVRYYLDINGRYTRKETLLRLLKTSAAQRVVLIEEPFEPTATFDVADIPARLAVDESLHDIADLPPRVEQGYKAVAIKPAGKTLTVAFEMAAAAKQYNLDAFVADNACVPTLVDWNKNIAARLAAMSPLNMGLLETNGPESYPDWHALLRTTANPDATWITPKRGVFRLDKTFYETAGGIFNDPPQCAAAFN